MLRDVLCNLPNIATWPCDEINYIWRHGNVRHVSDEFTSDMARPAVTSYIRRQFDWVAQTYQAKYVIEKTCASSLRVNFVDKVLPDAKYIFIVRDGIDATGSAKDRWTATLDIPYILEKVRFVPKMDLPYYAIRYFWARIYRLVSREKRLAFWGPALENMQAILQKHTLNEVCALQWKKCVDKAEEAFSAMPVNKVVRVRYEDFVREPQSELGRILEFMGKDVDAEKITEAVKNVSPRSLGKGRKALGDREVTSLESLVGATLKRYGYL